MITWKRFSATIYLALIFVLLSQAGAFALQSNTATGSKSEVSSTPPAFNLNAALQPALEQVGTSVSQIQIDHWKLSSTWKSQLQNDADSIQQDLAHQLPALLQEVQASPAALDAQMRVMQNVNALYDVLVRVTIAANLADKKKVDATILTNALQRLESARKTASNQLLQAISLQSQQIAHLQSQKAEAPEHSSSSAKTIIVNNEATHRTHRQVHPKKASPASPATKNKPK